MKHILTTLFILLNITLLADDNVDSLRNVLTTEVEDSARVNVLWQLARYYQTSDVYSALEYGNQALMLVEGGDYDPKKIGQIHNAQCTSFLYLGDYKNALDQIYRARQYFEETGDSVMIVVALTNIGAIYTYMQDFTKARDYYLQALDIYKTTKNRLDWRQFEFDKLMNNIGITYKEEKKYDEALDYYNVALSYQKDTLSSNAAQIYHNMGLAYYLKGNLEKGKGLLQAAIKIKTQINDLAGLPTNYVGLYNIYMHVNNTDSALVVLQKALKISEDLGLLAHQNACYRDLSAYYKHIENYEKALAYFELYKTTGDSILNQENIKQMSNIEMQYKYDKLQKQREIRQKELQFRYYIIAAILVALLAIITLLYALARNRAKQSRLKNEKLKLERQNLQEDLNHKNKSLATNVMYLVRKNELINSISERLLELKFNLKQENRRPIEDIVNELQSNVDEDIWNEFEMRFQQVHESFYGNLNKQFPDLTSNERKLCAFLRLNMSTKEISAITFQSINSIRVARSRLRKKLGMDRDENLIAFLSQL